MATMLANLTNMVISRSRVLCWSCWSVVEVVVVEALVLRVRKESVRVEGE
jgi:hypothetical protein